MQIADNHLSVQHSTPNQDNFNIQLGDVEQKVNQIPSNTDTQLQIYQTQYAAQIPIEQLPPNIVNPSFPSQLCHCLLKYLAIFVYFIPVLNDICCYIIVAILSASDFWAYKSAIRRKLYALKLWREGKEQRSEELIHESQEANFIINPINSKFIWSAQLGVLFIWGIIFQLNLTSLRLFNAFIAITAFCLTSINFLRYYKYRDLSQQLSTQTIRLQQ